jgi:hypothetical protein
MSAKRQKSGAVSWLFLPHQRANVDQVPPRFVSPDTTTAARTIGCSSTLSLLSEPLSVRIASFLGPRGGTARFLKVYWLTSRHGFLMSPFLKMPAHDCTVIRVLTYSRNLTYLLTILTHA